MKYTFYLIAFILVAFSLSDCSPKVKEVVVEKETVDIPPVEIKEVNPNCRKFSDLSSSDRDEAETSYILYRDELKANNYVDAKKLWKTAFYLAPNANGRVKYQYDDGIKIYQHFYSKAKDEAKKTAYLDTIISIYDRRLECVQDSSYIIGRKAYDYYYTYPGTMNDDQLFSLFRKSLDMGGKKADYFIINPMTQMLVSQFQDKKIDKETTKKIALQIFDAVEYGVANCKRDCEAWSIVNDYAPNRLEAFEALTDFYDCDYYIDHYIAEFDANPTDCEVINRTYAKLKRGKCSEQHPDFQKVAVAKSQHCKVAPATAGPCRTGYDNYSDGQFKDAISSFEECVSSMTENAKKAKYEMLIAKIYYRDLKNFPKARKHALNAAKLRGNWGEPYMLIGRLYASSGPLCGTGRGFESQKVTWPAIDKWNYAKKIDPSVSAAANKLISTYSKYMPSKEDLFLRQLKEGSSYKVGCWINESTKIRAAK